MQPEQDPNTLHDAERPAIDFIIHLFDTHVDPKYREYSKALVGRAMLVEDYQIVHLPDEESSEIPTVDFSNLSTIEQLDAYIALRNTLDHVLPRLKLPHEQRALAIQGLQVVGDRIAEGREFSFTGFLGALWKEDSWFPPTDKDAVDAILEYMVTRMADASKYPGDNIVLRRLVEKQLKQHEKDSTVPPKTLKDFAALPVPSHTPYMTEAEQLGRETTVYQLFHRLLAEEQGRVPAEEWKTLLHGLNALNHQCELATDKFRATIREKSHWQQRG